MDQPKTPANAPGVCVPWDQKKAELPEITGDEKLVKKVWEQNDSLAYTFIWQLVVSF
jgi:methoxylated aromatic compound---corrinoid protein Co-methyltransferase